MIRLFESFAHQTMATNRSRTEPKMSPEWGPRTRSWDWTDPELVWDWTDPATLRFLSRSSRTNQGFRPTGPIPNFPRSVEPWSFNFQFPSHVSLGFETLPSSLSPPVLPPLASFQSESGIRGKRATLGKAESYLIESILSFFFFFLPSFWHRWEL